MKLLKTSVGGRAPPGQKSAGQLQYLVGSAQLLDLALKRLHTFMLGRGGAGPGAASDFVALDPFVQRLGHAADLGGDGFDGCPQRGVKALVQQP